MEKLDLAFITRVVEVGGNLEITHMEGEEDAVTEKFNGMVNAIAKVADWIGEFLDDDDNWDVEGIQERMVFEIKAFAKENGYLTARNFLAATYIRAVILVD